MKKILNILLLVTPLLTLQSQINEIGVFLGGSNFIGDIGNTAYVNPEKPAFGIVYKWNKTPRHSYRLSYTQSTIIGNDQNSSDQSRISRGYKFQNSVKEVSAGIEFNFLNFDLNKPDKNLTPYFFTGLSYFKYDGLYSTTQGQEGHMGRSFSAAVPLTLGVKTNLSEYIILGAEIGARYTFVDNIDGSNAKKVDESTSDKFGNLNNNDWYVFSGITLTYTFGQKPCYCKQ